MLVYICMSYLYEKRLSQEVLEMASLSVNTQLNTPLHDSGGGSQNLWCGSRYGCSPVTHQVYVASSCRHALLDDPARKS
jgi:hypothetical protein